MCRVVRRLYWFYQGRGEGAEQRDAAYQHVLGHQPVTEQAHARMAKGRGLVLFEDVVAEPSRAIAKDGKH